MIVKKLIKQLTITSWTYVKWRFLTSFDHFVVRNKRQYIFLSFCIRKVDYMFAKIASTKWEFELNSSILLEYLPFESLLTLKISRGQIRFGERGHNLIRLKIIKLNLVGGLRREGAPSFELFLRFFNSLNGLIFTVVGFIHTLSTFSLILIFFLLLFNEVIFFPRYAQYFIISLFLKPLNFKPKYKFDKLEQRE
jgi:hypothetical protein